MSIRSSKFGHIYICQDCLPFIPVKFDLMVISAKSFFFNDKPFQIYLALKVKRKNSRNRETAVSKLTGNERLIVFSF